MPYALVHLFKTFRDVFRSRAELLAEIAALRQQLEVRQRQVKRPRLRRGDRLFWIWLARNWPRWKSALVIVTPETVLRWQQDGYRRRWQSKPKGSPGRPRIPARHRQFIRRISSESPAWGGDRIALEMKLKLGIDHAASTVGKYMVDDGGRGMTWGTFLRHHGGAVLAEAGEAAARWRGSCRLCLATAVAASQQQVARTATGISRALAGLLSLALNVLSRSRSRWRQQADQRQVSGQDEGEEPATSTGRSRPQVDLVSAPALAWGSRRSPRAPPLPRPSDLTRPHLDDAAHKYELAA